MECAIVDFPCKYLGLPLSVRKLTKTALQSIINRMVDQLPGWKVGLLHLAGRNLLVKMVLTAIPSYQLMASTPPRWVIKAIDKRR